MQDVMISAHATERFIERFAGNLSPAGARARLQRLLRRARFRSVRPGHGRLYTLGEMNFLVQDNVLITVYRLRALPLSAWPWFPTPTEEKTHE